MTEEQKRITDSAYNLTTKSGLTRLEVWEVLGAVINRFSLLKPSAARESTAK